MTTSHHQVEELGSVLKITIRTPRPWGRIVLGWFGWIFMAAVLLFFLLDTSSKSAVIPGVCCLTIWAGGMLLAEIVNLFYLVRLLVGKEIIEVDGTGMTLRTQVLGFIRSQRYTCHEIKAFKVSRVPTAEIRVRRPDIWGNDHNGPLVLDLGAGNIRFGNYLDEAEGHEIRKTILERFPQYGWVYGVEPGGA